VHQGSLNFSQTNSSFSNYSSQHPPPFCKRLRLLALHNKTSRLSTNNF
jgi:hypothetical protein